MKDNHQYPSYSIAIRTLGTAGDKYLDELKSIDQLLVQPEGIFVYIPHGYDLPKETINKEQYIRCDKGMVAQRSLPFNEITSDYILFLDDDIFLAPDSVNKLFNGLLAQKADCISPSVFANNNATLLKKISNAMMGVYPHFNQNWAFRINNSGYYSYNNKPNTSVKLSQTGSFAALLINKKAYESIHYEDERWLDKFRYALMDDQLFFYKLFRYGYKVLTIYDSGIIHLDAGAGKERDHKLADYNAKYLRYVVWYRSIYQSEKNSINRFFASISFGLNAIREFIANTIIAIRDSRYYCLSNLFKAYRQARNFCKSDEFKKIPLYMKWAQDE